MQIPKFLKISKSEHFCHMTVYLVENEAGTLDDYWLSFPWKTLKRCSTQWYWWQNFDLDDRKESSETSISNLSPTHSVTNIRHQHRWNYEQNEHPSWDPKWFGFIKVAYLAIPISKGLNSTHSWYRIADSFGLTTTAVNIGIGCLKSVKRFWNSDNLFGGLWLLINSYQGQVDRWFQSARYGSRSEFRSDMIPKSWPNFRPDRIETVCIKTVQNKKLSCSYRPLIPAWFSYYVFLKELRQPCNQKYLRKTPVVHVYAFPINVLHNFLFVYKTHAVIT